jgi:hypothetical protein
VNKIPTLVHSVNEFNPEYDACASLRQNPTIKDCWLLLEKILLVSYVFVSSILF